MKRHHVIIRPGIAPISSVRLLSADAANALYFVATSEMKPQFDHDHNDGTLYVYVVPHPAYCPPGVRVREQDWEDEDRECMSPRLIRRATLIVFPWYRLSDDWIGAPYHDRYGVYIWFRRLWPHIRGKRLTITKDPKFPCWYRPSRGWAKRSEDE